MSSYNTDQPAQHGVASEIKELDEELLDLWRLAAGKWEWTKPEPEKPAQVTGICKLCRREFVGKDLIGMMCVNCRRR